MARRGKFRNGMRTVQAEQKPSGDWIVWTPEGIEYLQADEKFRQAWEPADDRGRAIWGRVPKMVLTVAVGRN